MKLFKDSKIYRVTEIKKLKGRQKYRVLYLDGIKSGNFFEELLFNICIATFPYIILALLMVLEVILIL